MRLAGWLKREGWAWALLLLFILWQTWWLWHVDGEVWVGDKLWYSLGKMFRHSAFGQAVLSGRIPDHIYDLNYPDPLPWLKANDYLLLEWMALWPTVAIDDVPTRWGVTQALWVLSMGVGVGSLARAMGARGLGVLVAGALAASCWPFWQHLLEAKGNVLWVGMAALTIATTVALGRWAAVRSIRPGMARWRRGIALWLAAAGLGACTVLIYPPLALLLAPLALCCLAPSLRRAPLASLGAALAVAGLGLLVSVPWLRHIFNQAQSFAPMDLGGVPTCPVTRFAVPGVSLLWLAPSLVPDIEELRVNGIGLHGAAVGAWALAPLALMLRRRRGVALLLVALAGLLVWLSLGPCASWLPSAHLRMPPLTEAVSARMLRFWTVLCSLRDFGRYLLVALIITAVLSGLGVSRLWSRRGLGSRLAALVLAAAAVAHASWPIYAGIHDPNKWKPISPPLTAQLLAQVGPGVAAELPFDERQQMLSVLFTPGIPRVNMLLTPMPRDVPPPGTLRERAQGDYLVAWLRAAGWGQPSGDLPTAAERRASEVRWIFFDPARCAFYERAQVRDTCEIRLPWALKTFLGPGREIGDGVRVWDVREAPAADVPLDINIPSPRPSAPGEPGASGPRPLPR